MATPLRYILNTNIDFREMSSGELALLRYNLRQRYANVVNANGPGRISIDGTTNFGSAVNTERTRVENVSVSSFPGANTGTTTRTTYNYGINLNGIPSFPTDFTNSYCAFDANTNTFFQAREESHFLDGIITQTINEMRTGDMLGTYMVAESSPGSDWTPKGLWFRDSIYSSSQTSTGTTIRTYNLYLKTSATAPAAGGVFPIYVNGNGDFQEMDAARYMLLENLLFTILQSRLGAGSLRYNIDGNGEPRGTFIDTRRSGTSRVNNFINADDYRTTATPIDGATTFRTYTLRIV